MSTRAKNKTRMAIRRQAKHSISVHKTANHLYVRLVDPKGVTLSSMSTLTPAIRKKCPNGGNKAAAKVLGAAFAKYLSKRETVKLAVDRSGFIYHGRIREVIEALREQGVEV